MEFQNGIRNTFWPGRAHIIPCPLGLSNITLHLDGAHTIVSIGAAIDWFETREIKPNEKTSSLLIFNNKIGKPSVKLLEPLTKYCFTNKIPFQKVFFCK